MEESLPETEKRFLLFCNGDLLFPRGMDGYSMIQGITLDESRYRSLAPQASMQMKESKGQNLEVLWFQGPCTAFDPADWERINVRALLALLQVPRLEGSNWNELSSFLRAYHVVQWREASRFCGYCGSPQDDAEDELARICPHCGRREYPRISPAVIVAITDSENRLLLARNRKFKDNVYALVAGFVEAGERLEDTVHREIREEVGISVDSVSYVGSQPWPFPASLMLAFQARYSGGELHCDGEEILDARWVTPDALPQLPIPGSISRYLIDRWLESWKR